MALLTARSSAEFKTYLSRAVAFIEQMNVREFEHAEFGHLEGDALLEQWWQFVEQITDTFRGLAPTSD